MLQVSLLTEKYRPASINEFVGLDKAKRICARLASNPFDTALLFVGASGTGKTTIALALADEMMAELHHIPSQGCTVEAIKDLRQRLAYLDTTNRPENTVFVFTCNETLRFEARFLSRCMTIDFSSYGIAKDATSLLARVWENEANGAPAPNFARIVKEANNNIRASLMELQKELLLA